MPNRILFSAIVIMLLALSQTSLAVPPVNASRFGGLAIKGYDPVAYFDSGKPVKGSKTFELKKGDVTWRFSSNANLQKFQNAPDAYSPQYGGYCAWAVSQGYTANIDPKAWKIVDAKLFLNYSPKIQIKWQKDIPGNIARADKNWPGLLKK